MWTRRSKRGWHKRKKKGELWWLNWVEIGCEYFRLREIWIFQTCSAVRDISRWIFINIRLWRVNRWCLEVSCVSLSKRKHKRFLYTKKYKILSLQNIKSIHPTIFPSWFVRHPTSTKVPPGICLSLHLSLYPSWRLYIPCSAEFHAYARFSPGLRPCRFISSFYDIAFSIYALRGGQ